MRKINWSTKLRLRPWVGASYGDTGVQTLILGESHYGIPEKASRDFTTETVMKAIAGSLECPGVKRFFTKTARIMWDGTLDREGREHLWQKVAFYNYLQKIVSEPRVAVEGHLFEDAGPAFEEVLMKLSPDLVIVLGDRNWNHMTTCDGKARMDEKQLPDIGAGRQYRELWKYPTADGASAFVFHVKHPSTAFKSEDFHLLYLAALERIKQSSNGERSI